MLSSHASQPSTGAAGVVGSFYGFALAFRVQSVTLVLSSSKKPQWIIEPGRIHILSHQQSVDLSQYPLMAGHPPIWLQSSSFLWWGEYIKCMTYNAAAAAAAGTTTTATTWKAESISVGLTSFLFFRINFSISVHLRYHLWRVSPSTVTPERKASTKLGGNNVACAWFPWSAHSDVTEGQNSKVMKFYTGIR